MKFTTSWLKQYVDVTLNDGQLADRLTMLGLEVDAVEQLFTGLDQVVVAQVEAVTKHPNADKLTLCEVSTGQEIKHVVCGAPNVRAGLKVALALPGAVLPGGFKIKPAKIRGEASEGMLCSEKELHISDGHGGIMELADELTLGQPVCEALGLTDTLIEVDLTPNRPDCTSILGIAREIAGLTGQELRKPFPASVPDLTGSDTFSVAVDDTSACPRYAARLLKNVQIGPSPWWLQRTLLAVGLRPINNVVDITNFVMLELGQPLHAFDFKKLSGGRIVVRTAQAGEKIITLDGVSRELQPHMLVICDAEKPVAVAGVMGGEESEVTCETTEVLLESAYFNPVSVRKTNRDLKLGTDASYRFERGIDPKGTVTALERAVGLMCEICGADVEEGGSDVCVDFPEPVKITLHIQRTSELLGHQFSGDELCSFLNGIEIASTIIDRDTIEAVPPSFRVDLEREADLVEEIARLYGYNEIPTTLPVVPMSFSEQEPVRKMRAEVAEIMIAQGFVEAINYSFIGRHHFDLLGLSADNSQRTTIDILNPLTEEQGVMRTTLLPGLLENLRHNLNRQNTDVRLFEVGKTFHPIAGNELPDEIIHCTAVCSGRRNPGSSPLYFGEESTDLYDSLGAAEHIFRTLKIEGVNCTASEGPEYVEPGSFLIIQKGEALLGGVGEISQAVRERFGLKQKVFYFDFNLTVVMSLERKIPTFQPLSKFPSVKWDLAVIVSDSVGAGDMINEILALKKPYLENAEIFDIYQGKPIAKGKKSVAIKITYHAFDKTLDDDLVQSVHQQVIDHLLNRFDGQLREE